jgi:hypothetical protein
MAHSAVGNFQADAVYEFRKLMGGAKGTYELPRDLGGIGALFILLDAGIPVIHTRYSSPVIGAGLKKAFVIPWGYGKLINDGDGDGGANVIGGTDWNSIFRTVLLSGLSVYLTASF